MYTYLYVLNAKSANVFMAIYLHTDMFITIRYLYIYIFYLVIYTKRWLTMYDKVFTVKLMEN